MPIPTDSSRKPKRAALVYSALFGLLCFFAGRFSVNRSASDPAEPVAQPALRPVTETNPKANPAAPENDANVLPAVWDEQRWHQIKSKLPSPANTAALAAMLEKLAATDPQRSMGLAQAEPNLLLRDMLVQAVLRGWAQLSPTDAAHWALAQPVYNARENGLISVFAGAVANNPEEAIRTGKRLAEEYPGEAVGYGGHLIDALCNAGNFSAAAQFAASGAEGTRSFWLGEAYSKWASFQPQEAAQMAVSIAEPTLRNQALHGVVGGWSMADPASLVQYVTKLPADTDKSSMVGQALHRWAKLDPIAASTWINNNEGGPEMDPGIASVATMESLKPDVDASWAESIVNPKLRSETLVSVLRNWATADLAATRNYFESSKDLTPEDRAEIAGVITTLGGQTAP